MPITQSMLPGLLEASTRANAGLAESAGKNALAAYLQAGEGKVAGQKQSAQNKANLETMKDPNFQQLLNEGGSVKVGDLAAGAQPRDYALQQHMQEEKMRAAQGQKLTQISQKAVAPYSSSIDALNTMHMLLDNPSSVSDKQLGAAQARLAEGQGQRLLQSLVVSMGAKPDVSNDATKSWNYLLSQAKSGVAPATANAMRQNLFAHQSLIEPAYNEAKQSLGELAPVNAPALSPDTHNQVIGAITRHSDAVLKNLQQKQQQFQQPNSVMANTSGGNWASRAGDTLSSIFGGMKGNPRNRQPLQPPPATGGFDPNKPIGQ